jgi:hypothetical protein
MGGMVFWLLVERDVSDAMHNIWCTWELLCMVWISALAVFFLVSQCVSCDVDEQLDDGDEDEFKPLFDYSDTVPVAPELLSSG